MRPGDEPSGHPIVPRFANLLEAGWDAHLVAVGGRAESADIPAGARSRVHEAAPNAPPRTTSGLLRRRRPPAVVTLASLVAELEPQLVHFPTTRSVLEWAEVGHRLDRTRFVAGFSGHDLDGQPFERLWRTAAGFHFESEALAEFARRSGMAQATASVVPPLADAELLARPPRAEVSRGELRMLSVGPLSWTQGFDHALAAVRMLRERGLACHYRIVGAGEYEDAVSFARYQLGVEENVELVKPTGRRGLLEQLDWADVLVVAAVVPTSPTTVLDAQAAGLAVVTTEAPPTCADGAIVVPRRNASALADALEQLAADENLRRRLAEAGRRAATASQDLDDQLRRFRDLYRTVLSASG
jgi:colanic acid/amylovoran biosynthesis glycosyltransferase